MGFFDAISSIGSTVGGVVEGLSGVVENLGGGIEAGIGAYSAIKQITDPQSPVTTSAGYPPAQAPGYQPLPYSPGYGGPLPVTTAAYGGSTMPTPYLTATPALGLPGGDIVSDARVAVLTRLTSGFVPTLVGARAQPHVQLNPITGRPVWFRPVGQPTEFSGDKAIAKRYAKKAGWRRSRGGR